MEVFMFRKVLVVLGAAALVAATTTAVPASAATKISNGVSCKKAGATTKVGTSTYRCAKNPLVKNAKLTWLSPDCITTGNSYNKALANLPKIKAATDSTIAKLDADIVKQAAQVEKAKQVIPEFQSKIDTITAQLVVLRADTANLAKNKKTIDSYASAVRNYEVAIRAYTTVGKQNERSQKARAAALDQFTNSKSEVAMSLDLAKLICKKGL
jgi:predicted RNase H-like HicB family nuclease